MIRGDPRPVVQRDGWVRLGTRIIGCVLRTPEGWRYQSSRVLRYATEHHRTRREAVDALVAVDARIGRRWA